VPRLVAGFFRYYGDSQRMVASVKNVLEKQTPVVAREVETHAGICFEEMLSGLPDEDSFDEQALLEAIIESQGRGTPLANWDPSESNDDDENSWGESLGLERVHDIFRGMFQTCGLSQATGHSPCDPPHCGVALRHPCVGAPSWMGLGDAPDKRGGGGSYKRIIKGGLGGQ